MQRSLREGIVAGRQGDCYILPILEVLASVARDCKRDILLRFCAGTCSASTDQARLANLRYLSMQCFMFPTSFLSFV
jgi:hypothetical protein